MISMSHIYGIILTLAYVGGIRLVYNDIGMAFAFCFELELFLLPLGDEIVEPRIGASGVIWRVRHVDNVIVRANRKALDFAKFGELCAKLPTEIGATFIIVGERHAKDCDGSCVLLDHSVHLVKSKIESGCVGVMFYFLCQSNYCFAKVAKDFQTKSLRDLLILC